MDEPIGERWLPVVGWEGRYEVSDLGRVKSLRRLRDGQLRIYIMKPRPCPHGGHMQVRLSAPGRRVLAYVHQMVLCAFLGPCPEGEEVRHRDDDPANNRLSNLHYGTHEENLQDMVRHGRSLAGTRHPRSALTDADVIAIRTAWQQGTEGKNLAARYGISTAAVSRIVNGRAYRDLPVLPRPPEKCHYPLCRRDSAAGKAGHHGRTVFCDLPEHSNYEAKKARLRMAS